MNNIKIAVTGFLYFSLSFLNLFAAVGVSSDILRFLRKTKYGRKKTRQIMDKNDVVRKITLLEI